MAGWLLHDQMRDKRVWYQRQCACRFAFNQKSCKRVCNCGCCCRCVSL